MLCQQPHYVFHLQKRLTFALKINKNFPILYLRYHTLLEERSEHASALLLPCGFMPSLLGFHDAQTILFDCLDDNCSVGVVHNPLGSLPRLVADSFHPRIQISVHPAVHCQH